MNIKLLSSAVAALAAAAPAALACSDLIAASGATTDGSVLISYAADSHTLYGDMDTYPAARHLPGEMRRIVDWDTGRVLGEIPEPEQTYSVIGHINEYGVGIGESTWGGRPELADSLGIIDYGSLMKIALQRSRSAREAIEVMTSLVAEYGYASEGESFSIADGREVWIMEMIGKGPGRKGAVWVARRVPDDCISGHANHSRIHRFPLDEPETTLYSPDVIDFAREKGYYEGPDSLFSFSAAYAVLDYGALRGCDARVWSYFNRFAPAEAAKWLPWVMEGKGEPMPLWVKPERKVSVRDMQWMMRDHFEGTPMDMTTDIGAGPFKVPYRWRPMSFTVDGQEYLHERAIATQQTGFSFVSQLRADVVPELRAVEWFGTDDANTCVYVPVFCSMTEVPHCYAVGNGDLYNISWDAAFWVHNYVANQAYNRYSQMIPDIRRVQNELEDSIAAATSALEAEVVALAPSERVARLTRHSHYWGNHSTKRFKALGDYLLVKYLDGNIKAEDAPGRFRRTPTGLPAAPKFGGYDDERYFRSIADETGDKLKQRKLEK